MVSTSQEIRFRCPELRIRFNTTFPLEEEITSIYVQYLHKSLTEMSEKQIKKCFHQPENPFPSIRMHLKIHVHKTEKKKLAPENGRKRNDFHQPKNQFALAGMGLFFKNCISSFPHTEQRSLNKIILFQLDGKSFLYVSIGRKNCFH